MDPEKVRAIQQMLGPTDVKDAQRVIGIVNHLTKFCPLLSDQCNVLRELSLKDRQWKWTTEHGEALLKLEKTIMVAPVLKY